MTYSIKNTQLGDLEFLPGDQHIVPADESSSISPLSPIDILYEEFTNFKTFVCQKLKFIKQELSHVEQNTNKGDRRNCNYETCYRDALDEKIILLESNSSFLLQELHNKQRIIEKILDNIPSSNSNKAKTVQHPSENRKQKVQHQEKQQEKLLETIRQTIKETAPPQKVNRSNADKNKEPRKKVMILGDSIIKGLNEYGLSKNPNVKVQSFSGHTTEDMLDIVKPAARRKPDAIIIHAGANDITRDINTVKTIRKTVKLIRDSSGNTQVLLSGIINQEDGNYNDKISEINTRMASYSEG